jgi:hypothetical protein
MLITCGKPVGRSVGRVWKALIPLTGVMISMEMETVYGNERAPD